MANSRALHSFSQSLRRLLDQSWQASGLTPRVTFEAVGSGWFVGGAAPAADPLVTLFLHRVAPSPHARPSRTCQAPGALSVDLHFLATVWAEQVENEQRILGWVMQLLHHNAVFDSTVLTAEGGWGVDEAVGIFPIEMPGEEVMRIFESARRPARVSWPFIARVVRIVTEPVADGLPVVAVREGFRAFAGKEGA